MHTPPLEESISRLEESFHAWKSPLQTRTIHPCVAMNANTTLMWS